jgi:hypothetical protein
VTTTQKAPSQPANENVQGTRHGATDGGGRLWACPRHREGLTELWQVGYPE